MNTASEALDFMAKRAASGAAYNPGNCLGSVRDAYATGAFGGDAGSAYAATKDREGVSAPPDAGCLVWWLGGSEGHGHVAISDGRGGCYSTDFGRDQYYGDGKVRLIPLASVAKESSAAKPLKYVGFSYDLDGQSMKETTLILVQKKTGGPIYLYTGNHIEAVSQHQADRMQRDFGAKFFALNATDEIFSLTPPGGASATSTGVPAHVHPISASQTGAAK